MNYRLWVSIAMLGLSVTTGASGDGTAARMDSQLCSICHGYGGVTSSELFPHLAGEPAPYVAAQLKAFRDRSRTDQNAQRFMWGIAGRLSDQEIEGLAAYYASQPPVHDGKITDQAQYDAGRKIFLTGMEDKGVPACMACHGEKGEGRDTVPRLGGQSAAYLTRQLKVFYSNDRPAAVAMHEVVKGLSEDNIAALAQYLQAQ